MNDTALFVQLESKRSGGYERGVEFKKIPSPPGGKLILMDKAGGLFRFNNGQIATIIM